MQHTLVLQVSSIGDSMDEEVGPMDFKDGTDGQICSEATELYSSTLTGSQGSANNTHIPTELVRKTIESIEPTERWRTLISLLQTSITDQ